MVQWNDVIPLKSDVIIAPHHGGDNGSSVPFINLVDPDFVIFSAGNTNGHPRKEVAQRYITQGVPVANMFRTDRGSNAGGNEWPEENPDPNGDKRGDDDVDIILPEDVDADVTVSYRQ